jgi:hypothetical protein
MDFTNNTHDDVADTLSDAFYHLNQSGVQLPANFVLPDFSTRVSSFGFQDATIPSELVTRLN